MNLWLLLALIIYLGIGLRLHTIYSRGDHRVSTFIADVFGWGVMLALLLIAAILAPDPDDDPWL